MKKRKADDITKCPKCLAYYSRSHAKEFGHRCNELIIGLINANCKKRKDKICIWNEDSDGGWVGSCKIRWSFDDGTPNENGVRYCPGCGEKVVEVKK